VNLAGTHIVVTGGSQGIGFACARECLRRGARVTIAARTLADLEAARERLAAEGAADRIHAVACDVRSKSDVARLFERAAARAPIGGLIHAAGVIGPIGASLDIDPSAWWDAVTVNLFGTFLVVRTAGRRMRDSGGGRIVVLSGGGAATPFPNYTAYAAGKAAGVRFVESIAIEFAPHGIEINALAPGFVATRMHDETLAAGPSAAGIDFFERTKAELERGGVPPEVGANAAAFLVSSAARGITGKLVAAQWDGYERWRDHLDELRDTDIFTLRRIVPKDRGLPWQ
jgi:NAD(P)-dependent dehydrogenase (short-subunit alcohol dehydrogenase family)